jgi:hypothetical protein
MDVIDHIQEVISADKVLCLEIVLTTLEYIIAPRSCQVEQSDRHCKRTQ